MLYSTMFHLKLKNFEIEKFKIKIYLNYILKNTIEIHFFIKKLKYCVKYLKEPECCRNLLNIGRGTTPQIKKIINQASKLVLSEKNISKYENAL